jgi:hypothetical protein
MLMNSIEINYLYQIRFLEEKALPTMSNRKILAAQASRAQAPRAPLPVVFPRYLDFEEKIKFCTILEMVRENPDLAPVVAELAEKERKNKIKMEGKKRVKKSACFS